MSEPLTDTCPMPVGKFKGTDMEDVPAWHLIWYYDQDYPNADVKVMAYVEENMDVLRSEL